MFEFTATTKDRTSCDCARRYRNTPTALACQPPSMPKTAAAIVLDAFKRQVLGVLELLVLECVKIEPSLERPLPTPHGSAHEA